MIGIVPKKFSQDALVKNEKKALLASKLPQIVRDVLGALVCNCMKRATSPGLAAKIQNWNKESFSTLEFGEGLKISKMGGKIFNSCTIINIIGIIEMFYKEKNQWKK